ncbi:MAG: CBS domain-containing protein [Chromatocurvus sp.]
MYKQYMPLNLRNLSGPVRYFRPAQLLPATVGLDSPAILTMTDLRQVAALTVEPSVTIDWALNRMRVGGVRLLLVVHNHDGDVSGLVTATDILGDKPIRLQRELNLRHTEIRVRDIMSPRSQLEFIFMEDVLEASVGNVLETLRRSGRQHALVYDCDHRSGMTGIRGIFSATRLSRQLGISFEPIEVAQTFAEVELALNNG